MGNIRIELNTANIVSQYLAGHSVVSLSLEHYVSEATIRNRLRECGVLKKCHSEYNNPIRQITSDNLKRLYIDECLTTRQIASMYGVSHKTVSNLLKEHNIPARSKNKR